MADEVNIVPSDHTFVESATDNHYHTPSTGGEIVFNNVDLVNLLNSEIRERNKTVDDGIVALEGDPLTANDHQPYLSVPAQPTQAYNVHHHSSEFDGGLVWGSTLHDHRGNEECGFTYAVYAPGTNLPKLAYEREESF